MDADILGAAGDSAHGGKAADKMPALMEGAPVVVLEVLDSGTRDPEITQLLGDLPETRECNVQEGVLYYYTCADAGSLHGRLPLADGVTLYRRNGTDVREGLTQLAEPSGELAPLPDYLRERIGTAARLREDVLADLDDDTPIETPEEALEFGAGGKLAYTDAGHAKSLVGLQGHNLRYCDELGGYFVWDNGRWRRSRLQALKAAKCVSVSILGDAARAKNSDDVYKALLGKAKNAASARGIENMLKLAAPDLQVDPTAFDQYPMLLNVSNGTIDLETGELRRHRRDDLLTKVLKVTYDTKATCPQFVEDLRKIACGDAELFNYILRALAYSITGSVKEKALFICYGEGDNGKSTLLTFIQRLLGPYASQLPNAFLLRRKFDNYGPRDGIAQLYGIRFAVAIENDKGARLSEAFVKWLTGGDRLTGQFLYHDPFEFDPTHHLWLATNHRPRIEGNEHAIWTRLHPIPFLERFEKDDSVAKRWWDERAGILRLLVEACLEWRRDGLRPPKLVQDATNEYREESNPLKDFVENHCDLPANDPPTERDYEVFRVGSSELYNLFKHYNPDLRDMSQKNFVTTLMERWPIRNKDRFKKPLRGKDGRGKEATLLAGITLKGLFNPNQQEQ